MKLLPKPRTNVRVNSEDALGLGMDAVIVIVLFLLAGFGLDSVFGTMPIFMIIMTVLGAVGLFAKFKYRYDERMNEHEAERLAKLGGQPTTRAAAKSDSDGAPAGVAPEAVTDEGEV